MKEASGEANMTVVTIVLIAIVLGVGTVIVKNIMSSTEGKTWCAEAGGAMGKDGTCYDINGNTIKNPNSNNTNG